MRCMGGSSGAAMGDVTGRLLLIPPGLRRSQAAGPQPIEPHRDADPRGGSHALCMEQRRVPRCSSGHLEHDA